jgi:F420-dependent oxidoreductase-like protein
MRLPDPCLVVLVGATGAGKSQWAHTWFDADRIVSSDRLRAVVGTGERDQRASRDAFEVLDLIVDKRLRRRLTTVIDSTGLEPRRRAAWRALAERHGVPAHAVVFDPDPAVVRQRNRARGDPVPAKVVAAQVREARAAARSLFGEGFAGVHAPEPVTLVPPAFLTAPEAAARQQEDPMRLEFGLQVSRFDWPGHPATTASTIAEIARAAEAAGFTSLWLMDHFVQIPQVGREWQDMLESHTTLAYLAGATERIRLGTLVTGITYRNIAHLAKIVATLDVLSGGRAMLGIGAGWYEEEARGMGFPFPPLATRFEMLEEAIQICLRMWHGEHGDERPFLGTHYQLQRPINAPQSLSRPHPPILIGGGGEQKTLRLVAKYADACNLYPTPELPHKLDVLRRHCEAEGRDYETIEKTCADWFHLGPDRASRQE